MKRNVIAGTLVLIAFAQSASAQIITDLPDPSAGEVPPVTTPVVVRPVPSPTPSSTPAPVPVVPTPVRPTTVADSLSIDSISRKSGGTIYTVTLNPSQSLVRLDLKVKNNRVKIHRVNLVTTVDPNVELSGLRGTGVLETNASVSSENINQSYRISAIELTMESYGGEADVLLTAVADRDIPLLSLKPQPVVVQPARPVPPPPPPPPAVPNNPQRPLPPPPPPVQSSYQVYPGDRVYVSGSNYSHTVEVVRGSKAMIINSYTGSRFMVNVSDLAVASGCSKARSALCVSDRTYIVGSNYSHVVVGLFADGSAYLQNSYTGTSLKVAAREIAVTSECASRGLCVTDKIYVNGSNYQHSVLGVYGNGDVAIQNTYTGTTSRMSTYNVAITTGCGARGVCVSDSVYLVGSTYRHTILGFFGNGQAYVQNSYTGTSSTVSVGSLAVTNACAGSFCFGDNVRIFGNSSGAVFKVLGVLENGDVYLMNNYSGTCIRVSSRQVYN